MNESLDLRSYVVAISASVLLSVGPNGGGDGGGDYRPVSRASIIGAGFGTCTQDPVSLTGMVTTSKIGNWRIHASGLRP